jgi:hypothetical protein
MEKQYFLSHAHSSTNKTLCQKQNYVLEHSMLTLKTFNILKSHIIITPLLSEALHASFLDIVLTRMVYRTQDIFLTYSIFH